VGFLSAAHTGEHVDLLAAQIRKAMQPEGG
jgi:hypothetical protein